MSMSLGPSLIYDKSTIQSLSQEESHWLHHHFHVVMTSIFMIELVSNLHKKARSNDTPESAVAKLSSKIPSHAFTPTIPYNILVEQNLLGNQVVMDGRPLLGGGTAVPDPEGGYGVFFEESPEAEVLRRWHQQDFTGMERSIAAQWKRDLEGLDLRPVKQALKGLKQRRPDIKTDKDLFLFVRDYVFNPMESYRILTICMEIFDIEEKTRKRIVEIWKQRGRKPIDVYAPYSAYALCVELFFVFGMAFDFIADTRPKHRSDFAYLYYLPFAKIFTSSDKLHIRFAPGFLNKDQIFVEGNRLKEDLNRLSSYYSSLPESERRRGTRGYAKYPPKSGNFLITKIYDIVFPEWRVYSEAPDVPPNPERSAKLLEKINRQIALYEQSKRG